MNLLTICARGGSKGIPNKNLSLVNGKPLIWYTLNFVKTIRKDIEFEVVISSDSKKILEAANSFDFVKKHVRPKKLATDSAGKIEVLADVVSSQESLGKSYDYVFDLDVTSPIRSIKDLKLAFEKLKSNEKALNIFSVSKASKNPYFNMVEPDESGFVKISKSKNEIFSRQKAPEVFQLNASFYIYRKEFFAKGLKSAITNYSLAYLMPHICFDIDEEIDLKFLEFLIENKTIQI